MRRPRWRRTRRTGWRRRRRRFWRCAQQLESMQTAASAARSRRRRPPRHGRLRSGRVHLPRHPGAPACNAVAGHKLTIIVSCLGPLPLVVETCLRGHSHAGCMPLSTVTLGFSTLAGEDARRADV